MASVPETSLTIADDDADDDANGDADDGIDVSLGAGLYLAGVLEYLIAEILHQAVAQNAHKPNRINPHHILQAICNDPELTELFPDFRLLDAKTSSEAIISQPGLCSEKLRQHGCDSQHSGISIKKNRHMSPVDEDALDVLDALEVLEALEVLQVLLEHRQLQDEVCRIYPGFKQRLITSKDVFKVAIENQTSWKGTRKRGLQETFAQCMLYVRCGTSQIPNAVKSLVNTFGGHVMEVIALVESYLF